MPSSTRIALLATIVLSAVSTSALSQDTKPTPCKVAMESVPIQFGGVGMLPVVPASINGISTLAIINLSAPDTTLNKETLEKIGVRVGNARSTVRGVGGSAPMFYAKVDEITVGPAKGKGKFRVRPMSSSTVGVSVGTDYLLRMDLELSFAEKAIRFIVPEKCSNAHLAYWSNDAVAIPFNIDHTGDMRPEFTIKVDGKELTAMLSTSQESSFIDVRAAARLPGKTAATFAGQGTSRAIGLSNDTMPVWESEFKLIEIGGEQITNSKLNVMSLHGIDADVLLGMDFIRSHRILISMSQRRMYFTYTGGPVFTSNDDDAPWLKAEAEAGNADAMYRLGTNADSRKTGNPNDALDWYRKAASLAHHGAKERLATHEFWLGNLAASAQAFRDVFQQRVPRGTAAALFYTAAARSGERAAAAEELKTLRTKMHHTYSWPDHILDFHLDKITGEKLLKYAVEDEQQSRLRLCEGNFHIGQHQLIAGQHDAARVSLQAARESCPAGKPERHLAVAELKRLDNAPK